ncbi:MAG TPA: hypothetical protein VFH99_00965 [Candidatus Saccharimonadales bacterium]|nr:hypothetical protein [Candidatus Saccharimonadales bacterium]
MDKLAQSRVASVLMIALGVWMLITPLVISMTGAALVNILITGAIIAVVSLIQLLWVNALPSWVNTVAVIWLFISAFAFTMGTAAAWNQAVFAVIGFVLSIWDGMEMTEVQREHHSHA